MIEVNENGLTLIPREVTIELEEYKELIQKADYFHMMLDAIYDGASLGYNGRELRFDGDTINAVLKVLDNYIYNERLKELKEKANESDNDK